MLHEAGVPVTINSDDPTFFGTTLVDEYARVHDVGVPPDGILEMARNAFRFAFLPRAEIETYVEALENAWGMSHD